MTIDTITDKLAIPADLAQAFFGKNFGISEDGQIVAKDANGNEIYSRITPGQKAGFEEALESLIDAYPHKDSILKGSQASGSGSNTGQGGNPAVPKSLSECKTDDERIAYMRANSQ